MNAPTPNAALLRRIDRVCVAFERSWRDGTPTAIEAVLAEAQEGDRAHLLAELLALEWTYRRQHGERPLRDEYAGRFAAWGGVVESAWQRFTGASTIAGPEESSALPAAGPTTAGGLPERYRRTAAAIYARGGMGDIWLDRDERLGRVVAMKELQPRWLAQEQMRRRFLAEAKVTARLEHPGIVPVYDLVEPDGEPPRYAMRLVRGRTLAEAVRQHHGGAKQADPLELRELLGAFVQVCQTLAYAHSRGVIHRDLKPANIILGPYGEVLVLDWGIAKVLGDAEPDAAESVIPQPAGVEATQGAVGTYAYMPPEQAEGRTALVDRRSDVFGLGAVLYEVLTGRAPYAGQALAEQARTCQPAAPWSVKRGVPAALDAVCLKALAREQAGRYQSAQELGDEVKRWLSGEPPRAWREPLAARAGRWVRRNRVLAAAVAAALLVALVLGSGGAVWVQQHKKQERLVRLANKEKGEATIAQAAQLVHRMRWKEARVLLAQARVAVTESQDEGLRETLEQAEADLNLAEDLDRVREEGHSLLDGKWNPGRIKDRYEQVCCGHGLDVLQGPAEKWVQRIRASAVRNEILAALDDWASAAPEHQRRRLLGLACGIDPDNGWRKQLLDPGVLRDPRRRLALLAQVKEESLGPGTAIFLSRLLGPRTPEALKLLQLVRERNPDDFWLNFTLAHALAVLECNYVEERDRSRQDEAIGYLRAALAVKRDSPAAHNDLGFALFTKGDVEGSIRSCQQAIRLDPRFPYAHGNLGNALKARGDLEVAILCFKEAIRLDPRDGTSHNGLGFALYDKGDLDGAISSLREAVRLAPWRAVVHDNLGAVLQRRGDLDGAIRSHRMAIRIDPQLARAHSNLGNALYVKGDVEGAVRSCREAIRLDPRLAAAHANLGLALGASGDVAGAIRSFREAIRLDPKFAGAHHTLGVCLRRRGDVAGALGSFREAIRLDPKYAVAYTNLGAALHASGEVGGRSAACARPSASTPRTPSPTPTSESACATAGTWPGRSAACARPSASTPRMPRLTPPWALPCTTRGGGTRPSPATRRPSNSNPGTRGHRLLPEGHRPRPEVRLGSHPPGGGLAGQGEVGRGPRLPPRGHPP
jgi:tetratricopeptide (TPR) repeat protein/tRNA A-37 threonylcarbamoyl transferase component Bud32